MIRSKKLILNADLPLINLNTMITLFKIMNQRLQYSRLKETNQLNHLIILTMVNGQIF